MTEQRKPTPDQVGVDQPQGREGENTTAKNRVAARIAGAIVLPDLLRPDRGLTNNEAIQIRQELPRKGIADINYQPLTKLATSRVSEFWGSEKQQKAVEAKRAELGDKAEELSELDIQKQIFAEGLATWVVYQEGNTVVTEILADVGITVTKGKDKDTYYEEIKKGFWQRYFGEGEANIGRFINDVARECHPDGDTSRPVDRDQLQERLEKVEGLLGCFDTYSEDEEGKKDIPALVQAYGDVYADLSESRHAKETQIVLPIIEGISQEPTAEEARLLRLLAGGQEAQPLLESSPKQELFADIIADSGAARKDRKGQDRSFTEEKNGVFGVSDGVSRSIKGELAAEIGADTIQKGLSKLPQDHVTDKQMLEVIRGADQAILNHPEIKQRMKEDLAKTSETTACVVKTCVHPDGTIEAVIVLVGDSNAELIKPNGELIDLTDIPDSLIRENNELVMFNSHLGSQMERINVSIIRQIINPGEQILVTSDGVDDISSKRKAQIALQANSATEAAEKLVQEAYDHPNQNDDATAVLIKFKENSEIVPVDYQPTRTFYRIPRDGSPPYKVGEDIPAHQEIPIERPNGKRFRRIPPKDVLVFRPPDSVHSEVAKSNNEAEELKIEDQNIFGIFVGRDTAPKIAAEHIFTKAKSLQPDDQVSLETVELAIQDILRTANDDVGREGVNTSEPTTTMACVVKLWEEGPGGEKKLVIGNVGNNRVYRYQLKTPLKQLTTDDTNMLDGKPKFPQIIREDVTGGDMFLLLSKDVYENLPPEAIRHLLSTKEDASADKLASELKLLAMQNRKLKENETPPVVAAVVLKIPEDEEEN